MPEIQPGLFALHFPKAGVDRSRAFGRPPYRDVGEGTYARTAPVGVNVRAFEQQGRRRRGGSRSGLSKYLDTKPGGLTWVTQHLACLVTTGGTAVPVQTSQSGRRVSLLAVAQGNVYRTEPGGTAWEAATNNSGATPPLNFSGLVRSTSCNQKQWFVDGTNMVVYDPKTNAVSQWLASAGSLPVDANGDRPRHVATWRGRVVLAGLPDDPANWFMSRVGDPTDFNYASAANDAAQAVAGNNSPLGKVGDVITTLIPYSDDVLVFGGDSSIYRMQGDPFYGGQIDLVTDRVGMAWGAPWCRDPSGRLFFFSSTGGVYVLDPTAAGAPVRISQPVEQLVQAVNTGTHGVIMEWDDTFQELHVWVTKLSGQAATDHFAWEERTRAWWVDRYADAAHNPLCSCVVDGNLPEDRAIVVGGWDGYVRRLDPAATDDDGTPIASEVLVGPLRTEDFDEITTDQIQAVMGEDSGDVTLELLAGKTAELALAADPIPVGTLSAGRGPTFPARVAGHAVYAKLTSADAWSIEELRVRLQTRGKVRRRIGG